MSVLGDQHVEGLDVPVDDAGTVHVPQRGQDLAAIGDGLVRRHQAAGFFHQVVLADQHPQVGAKVFHDVERPALLVLA